LTNAEDEDDDEEEEEEVEEEDLAIELWSISCSLAGELQIEGFLHKSNRAQNIPTKTTSKQRHNYPISVE
jgi:hypothetical protein